ncbi:hypothetical protein CXU13_03430 [Akkermansia muciniphila]|nr:hypothetical protein CXU12_10845 [Akkermansia muciniphila]PNC61661.1 hypothetical protein CXU13_03430 [Akkermansia muciniphila]
MINGLFSISVRWRSVSFYLPQRLAALHAVRVESSGLFRQAIPPQAVHGKTRENGVFPGTAILPPSGQGASLPFLR